MLNPSVIIRNLVLRCWYYLFFRKKASSGTKCLGSFWLLWLFWEEFFRKWDFPHAWTEWTLNYFLIIPFSFGFFYAKWVQGRYRRNSYRDILSKNLHKLKYFIYFFMQKLRFIAESFSKENFFFSSSIKLKYEVTKTSAIHIT